MASKMSASSVSGGNANNNFATSAKDTNNTTGVAGIASVSANADVHPRKRKIRSKVNNTVNNSEERERERERVRERERSTDRDHHSHHHFHHHHNAKSGGGASSVGSGAPSATTHTLTNTGGAHLASNNTVGINNNNTSLEQRGASAGSEERSAVGASANASGGVAYATTAGKSDGNAAAHDYPFTNCFQMCLNLRKQLEKKWRNLYLIKPRPPQGYAEYLLNKRTYLLNPKDGLAGTTDDHDVIVVPASVAPKMSEIYTQQEQERQCLFKRHTVERQKLCLNVEQEIIRVHSKAAHNISCQSLPYSVCTLLKDEEVYNFIDQTNEEKDRSNRHRFNGRQLLSWLQDVDDKWEKIKDSMILRHHNEAESLHAVQLMDWEIALKKYELCDFRTSSLVDEEHVPIINVNETFDLLPS